ncbi:MAG: PHP domain-containing protein [bacterium]|nr:PHP domain-containing protein [bacterium]
MLIDLQIHSTYSDGYLTPSQLADFLSANSIKIAALTDHNTIGGLDEFKLACKNKKIKTIPGVELYVKHGHKKFNLLWYNFNPRDPELHNLLRRSQARRRQQTRNALIKLKGHGFKIDEGRLLDKFNHYVPLNRLIDHIFKIPANKKIIVKTLRTASPGQDEILIKIFKNRNFAKVSESYIGLKRILNLKKKIGGQLILNHPGKHRLLDRKFMAGIKKLGLDGLEVISPHHSIGAVMYLQRLAREYKLIMTGGSDFHRFEPAPADLNSCYNYFKIDSNHLTDIKKIIG